MMLLIWNIQRNLSNRVINRGGLDLKKFHLKMYQIIFDSIAQLHLPRLFNVLLFKLWAKSKVCTFTEHGLGAHGESCPLGRIVLPCGGLPIKIAPPITLGKLRCHWRTKEMSKLLEARCNPYSGPTQQGPWGSTTQGGKEKPPLADSPHILPSTWGAAVGVAPPAFTIHQQNQWSLKCDHSCLSIFTDYRYPYSLSEL